MSLQSQLNVFGEGGTYLTHRERLPLTQKKKGLEAFFFKSEGEEALAVANTLGWAGSVLARALERTVGPSGLPARPARAGPGGRAWNGRCAVSLAAFREGALGPASPCGQPKP